MLRILDGHSDIGGRCGGDIYESAGMCRGCNRTCWPVKIYVVVAESSRERVEPGAHH